MGPEGKAVDQIFDRFERLFKSWVAGDAAPAGWGETRRSGDSDFDAAMDELDDFLDRGRTETESRERAERLRREKEEAARRGGGTSAGSRASGPHPAIVAAYRTLGLPYGAPFQQVKVAYKKLLMANHPDRNSATPEQLKRSTEISAQINAAYQRLETWSTTGVVAED
jgi:hypothetical protein